MPTIRTVKIHDPKNPKNIIQVNDPEIPVSMVPGYDHGPTFDPKIHVKLRPQGERYTAEEEALLSKYQSAYEARQAERRKSSPEIFDDRDAYIMRLERELAEARSSKPAAPKDEPVEDVSLVGLTGDPETKK